MFLHSLKICAKLVHIGDGSQGDSRSNSIIKFR